MNIKAFEKLPIMGIVRGISAGDIEPLVESVISAGLETLEITMNTPGAQELIKKAVSVSKGRLTIGAGTVLSMIDLGAALEAGATFIVMPVCIPEIMKECAKRKVPVFPGALTPQEVFSAWEQGASMVKVFPSGLFGPAYIKELKGPFDKIKLMAVGGVKPSNIDEFFKNGADAAAFGGSVFRKDLLAAKDFKEIGRLVGDYITRVKMV